MATLLKKQIKIVKCEIILPEFTFSIPDEIDIEDNKIVKRYYEHWGHLIIEFTDLNKKSLCIEPDEDWMKKVDFQNTYSKNLRICETEIVETVNETPDKNISIEKTEPVLEVIEEKTDVELMGEALGKLSLKKMPQEFYNEMNEIIIEANEDKNKDKKKRKDMKKRKYTIDELTENGFLKMSNRPGQVDKRCKAYKRGYVNDKGKLILE